MRLEDSGARVPLPRAFSRASVAPSAHWADRGARRMAPGGRLRRRHSSAVHGAFHRSLHLSQLDCGLHPPVADDGVMAALRRTRPSQPPGDSRGAHHVAWSQYIEQPGPQERASSLPLWSEGEEAKDGDSSVSSGRLSGSSGGHGSCTSLPGPWKERPLQAQGARQTPRESNPRLELLRDKIRAQARWQASCASLGTSTPSSASRLYRAWKPDPRRQARKLAHPDPAPWGVLGPGASVKGSGSLSEALCGREDKATAGPGREPSRAPQRQAAAPREKTKRMKSSPCKRERAPGSPTARRAVKDKDSELVGVCAWRKGPALARALLGPPPTLPRLQSEAPSRDLASAATAATELGTRGFGLWLLPAVPRAGAAESPPARPRTPGPASARGGLRASADTANLSSCEQPVTIQHALAVLRDLRRQIQAGLELARSHHPRGGPELGRSKLGLQDLAGKRKQQGPCSTRHVPSSFSESPQAGAERKCASSERPGSFPTGRRWSALAGWESYPQMTWAAQGQNPSLQRPGSPPERLTSFPQRPWSASAGQASQPQGAWATHEDWESPARRPWSPSAPRPRSASFTRSTGTPCKGTGSLLPPSELKHGWLRLARGAPGIAPGKENEVRVPPPCPKPRGVLGHPHSSESLREFMRQKTLARRRQALEEKASAVRALELRNQRLQDVYRKQREAILGKAVPVVSHKTPGIVTFFPHCAQSKGLEAPGSLGSPVLEWSKVTSGVVLGDQEAPGSFCLCLNRALNRTESLETGGPRDGAPMLMSARSSLGPLKLQDLATQHPRPGVCIYLDPEESEHLGMSGPLHFRYKQARLQALETMANILKQRIDILTAKLYKSEALDALGDPVAGPSPSQPSSMAAAPSPPAPVCSGTLVPSGGRGTARDRADTQAWPLVPPPCFSDSKTLSWSPDWERRQSVSPGALHDSQPHAVSPLLPIPGSEPGVHLSKAFTEDECLELDNRLARNMDAFQALRPFIRSSPGATAMLDAPCGSLKLEEMPPARGARSVTPWTLRSCGRRSEHPASIPQKSLGFLKSLQLGQQRQERALALLRQRAEREVWETQKALDELLFKHRLQQLMGKHSTEARPKPASEWGEPATCLSTVTARPRSHPTQVRAAAAPSQDPQEGQQNQEGKSAPAELRQEESPARAPTQLPLARVYGQDNPTHQRSLPGPWSTNPGAFGRFTLHMLDLSLRDEELRARHQAAILRLREKVLEEKMLTELAWLEHQRECLCSKGKDTMLAALAERQEQALRKLEQEQREIRSLQNIHLFSHQERKLLLQHQKDIVSLQRSMVDLRRELQARARLPQSPGLGVKTTQTEKSKASLQPKGPARGSSRPLTPPRPGSSASHCPRTSPETLRVQHLLTEQADGTPPQATSAADSHRPPPRPVWGEDAPAAGSWPGAGGRLAESHRPVGQGDPQTNPSPSPAEKARPLTDSCVQKLQSPNCPGGGGPCGPLEASALEGRPSRAGLELGLDLASSPVEEPHRMEGWGSREQRMETRVPEDPCGPFSPPEAAQLPAAPASAPAPPSRREGSPVPPLRAPSDPGAESEAAPRSRSRSGSRAGSRASSSPSARSSCSPREFQRACALLVQLSESSVSLSDWEAGDTPDTDPGWSGDFSPQDSCGPPRGGGQVSWERPEGGGAGPLQQGGLPPSPDAASPRSGSELSEASSLVWDEENLLEPGSGAKLASGCSSSPGGSSCLETSGASSPALASLGPGEGQEASGSTGSLISGSDTGEAKQMSPEAAPMPLPPRPPSSSDLDLPPSSPLGSLASDRVGLGRGETRPLQASLGCPEGPWDAAPSLPSDRAPRQLWSEPEVPVTPGTPPGDTGRPAAPTPQGWTPTHGGRGNSPVPEEAGPALSSGVLPEILSPVDEVLSYGSADLSSACRDAHLPPLPPTLPAEDLSNATSPDSEDFPSPPEDAMSPRGLLGPPGEDASIRTGELPSLPAEDTPEAPSPGPQESGPRLGAGRQGGSLRDKLGESSSVAGDQAVGSSQWSEPARCLGSPFCGGAGDGPGGLPRLPVQPPALPRAALTAREAPPTLSPGDPAPAPGAGPCADPPGVEGAEVVDLVSSQLSRRILCDSLAALSELAQPAAPR
ncbi:coiled-coil domain-containing protein 187 [Crocuta crocuta]